MTDDDRVHQIAKREQVLQHAREVVRWDDMSLELYKDTTFVQWQGVMGSLASMERALQFWIGDALNFGERKYGDISAQAVSEQQAKTWTNYAWVARSVESSRRRDVLSYSHHAAVASLDADKQGDVLSTAAVYNWNVKETRLEVRRVKGNPPPPKPREWDGGSVQGIRTAINGSNMKIRGYEVVVFFSDKPSDLTSGTPVTVTEARAPEAGG